ncbi:MAG: IS1595 family transposase [Candidatus Marinimicrobia bacterium]|nr:IS1595 family transposase [Candidatus Neomarinimicrobiota bacterium]
MKNLPSLREKEQRSPDSKESLSLLEQLRWGKTPFCPYCGSERISRLKRENRFHCNVCNTSFSATVNTFFHNTRIPLQKWFRAMILFYEEQKPLSVRRLASDIGVNKNTAWLMLSRLKAVFSEFGMRLNGRSHGKPMCRNMEYKIKENNPEILLLLLKKLLEFS